MSNTNHHLAHPLNGMKATLRKMNFPEGDAGIFYTRPDVTQFCKVIGTTRGNPQLYAKKDGKPHTIVKCHQCDGFWKTKFPDARPGSGELVKGFTVDSTPCTCRAPSLSEDQKYRNGGLIQTDSPLSCLQTLLLHFYCEQDEPIVNHRASPPPGFDKHWLSYTEEETYASFKPSPHLLSTQTEPQAKRARRHSESVHYFKLANGRWLGVIIRAFSDGHGSKIFVPVTIPDATRAAKVLMPVPVLNVDTGKLEQANAALSCLANAATTEAEAKRDSNAECMLCFHERPQFSLRCTKTEGCPGGQVCAYCFVYCGRKPAPVKSGLLIRLTGARSIQCYICRSPSSVTDAYRISKNEDGKTDSEESDDLVPIHFPLGFMGGRPFDSFDEVKDNAPAFDLFYLPTFKDETACEQDLAFAEYKVADHVEEGRSDSDPEAVAARKRVQELQDELNKYRYPDWAVDWQGTKAVPTWDEETWRFPAGKSNHAAYLDRFDRGYNPRRPRMSQKGTVPEEIGKPFQKWWNEFSKIDKLEELAGQAFLLESARVGIPGSDAESAIEVADDDSASVALSPTRTEDSEYLPNSDSNSSD